MTPFVITTAVALLLGGTALNALQAQETGGTQQELLKNPDADPATAAAPGQRQKSGGASEATAAAQGQQQKASERTAEEVAPAR